jgi:hypothetical protein
MTFLVVVSLAFGLVGLRSYVGNRLQGPVVAEDLALDLQSGAAIPTVRCPSEEPRRAGTRFYCSASSPGEPTRRIEVTETASNGGFRYRLLPVG